MDADSLMVLKELASDITTAGVLLLWIYQCQKKYDQLLGAVISDWTRQNAQQELQGVRSID